MKILTLGFAILLILIVLSGVTRRAFSERETSVPRTDVFVAGEEGYHTFRIPAVVVTAKGTLLSFCEGRKNNRRDHGDIDLVLKRSADGGKTWGDLQVVYEEGGQEEVTIGNPCPVVDRNTGTIVLPFCRDNLDVFVTKSTDDGASWSQPVEITKDVKKPDWGLYFTGPGVGIQMRSENYKDRLIVPCIHREKMEGRWVNKSHVFFSDDGGESWDLGDSVALHTDECQVVEREDGSLLINMRNYWEKEGKQPDKGGMRSLAASNDGGETWSDLSFDSTLIEPVCQASFLRFTDSQRQDRSRLLFSNPASKDKRMKMTVRVSYDEGKTWPRAKEIHSGPAAYSCLTVLPDGSAGCLFECGKKHSYERIAFARMDLDWLESD